MTWGEPEQYVPRGDVAAMQRMHDEGLIGAINATILHPLGIALGVYGERPTGERVIVEGISIMVADDTIEYDVNLNRLVIDRLRRAGHERLADRVAHGRYRLVSTCRPSYDEDVAAAEEAGFVRGATIRHYEAGEYHVVGYFLVTDNSEYDGRLGIVYEKVNDDINQDLKVSIFGRPFAQMVELHVHQSEPPLDPNDPSEPEWRHPQPQRFIVVR